MPAAFDPTREALRKEVESAVFSELERVGPEAFSKAVLIHRFADRGVSAPTLYRWIDAPLKSGRAGQHLARRVKQAAAERAVRSANPSADAAQVAISAMPAVVHVNDIAASGGTLAVVEQIQACVKAALQVMEYARHEDGKVRVPKILLAASEHLRRSLETAARLQEAMFEMADIERFHAAIFEELRRESPELAERIVLRLQQLQTAWEPS